MIYRKYIALGVLIAALIAVVYFWRADIYRAGESACMALVSEKSAQANESSRRGAEDVVRDEQSRTKRDIVNGLCRLGIMRENYGCGE